MKKIISGIVALALGVLVSGVGASAANALPSTTSWTDAGLQQMFSVKGHLTWSADGLGIESGQTGTIQVKRPANSSVIAAYLMVSTVGVATAPTDVKINAAAVTFSHTATETTSGYSFTNYFSDVTSNVKTFIDDKTPGVIDIAVDNGAAQLDPDAFITGDALVVVFNTPSAPSASFVLDFGTSNPAGDNFSLAYPALTQPETADLEMSIGDAYSYGSGQTSVVTVNGQTLSDQTGHFDDCSTFAQDNTNCIDPALITVGGVGDNLTNPTPGGTWSPTSDDELYSLSPFVHVGDTQIAVNTLNASNDDNLFMAAFYLKDVAVTGAAPVSSLGAITTPKVDPVTPSKPTLANTGANGSIMLLSFVIAGMLIAGGSVALVSAKRRS
jgi:hypothetical protein